MNDETYDKIYSGAGPELDFAQLDQRAGFLAPSGDSSLEAWYRDAAKVKIGSLDDADLSRALRQGVHVPVTAPLAIARLAGEPWRGELYPGELAASLANVDFETWLRLDPAIVARAKTLARALREGEPDDDVAPSEHARAAFEQLYRRAAAATLRAALIVEEGSTADGLTHYELTPDNDTSVGKHLDNRVQIAGTERHHLRVLWEGDGYLVAELGHRGATINGSLLGNDGHGKRVLAPGDRIEVGPAVLRFECVPSCAARGLLGVDQRTQE